jgi:sugar phosphate isomerase/epimerase
VKLGIFAKTFAGIEPETVLVAAQAAGFEAVQYNMACSGLESLPARIDAQAAADVATAARRNGIEIAAISATYNMIHPSEEERGKGREALAAIARQASTMSCRVLTLCSGSADALDQWRHHPDNGSLESWRLLLREFEYLVPIAEQHDILLAVEPELANVVSSADRARSLLDTLRSDRVRIVLDPANLFEVGEADRRRRIIEEAVGQLGDAIVLAHAKDRRSDGRFAAAGSGVIDFEHFVATLRTNGFDGPLVAHGLAPTEASDVAAFLRRHVAERELIG